MTAQRSGLPKTFFLAAVLSPLALTGCLSSGGSGSGSNSACSEFDCEQMLSNLGDNVMLPAIEDFQDKAETLEAKASAYSKSLNEDGNGQDDPAKKETATAWEAAILSWQSVEMMQVGPLIENSSALRDSIYSWPGKSTCGVDQEVIKANEQDGYDITEKTPTRKGLAAIEYILYTDNLAHTCPANTDGVEGWASMSDDKKRAYRATYLEKAAIALSDRGDELVAAWNGDDGFLQELANPGSDGSRFDSPQDAVNAVSDALFYIEKQVKDIKLAEPLGIKGNCDTAACPEKVENPLSERSKQHIRENFLAFQTLFLGNKEGASSATGFDDFLDALSEENIAAAMNTDIQDSLDAVNAVNGSLKSAVADSNEREQVQVVHDKSKQVTDRLKNEFLAVIGLSIPDAAAGDGD